MIHPPRNECSDTTAVPRRHRFEISEIPLHAPWIAKAHEGLRIGHISDLHVGPATPAERIRRAVTCLNAFEPDLVFLTGDYVTRSRRPVGKIRQLLAGIRAPTFAVLGNHDHWVDAAGVTRELAHLGYTVLQNAHATLKVSGAPVTIHGIDDAHSRHDDVARTFLGAPAGGTHLVLAHAPVIVTKLPAHSGLICFSGHTHGGQLFAGRVTESLMLLAGEPFVRGLHEVNGNLLYVNRGLGYGLGSAAIRWRSPPEVALFTLTTRRSRARVSGEVTRRL